MAATSCRLANMVSPRVGAADRDDSLGVLILTGGVQVPPSDTRVTPPSPRLNGCAYLHLGRQRHPPPLRGGVTDSRDENTRSGRGTGSGRIGLWR
jgi:hypothetical protein